ncbi:MAG TPA: isoprenylcysteine carboxylmethyltransferase family protein [Nitrospirales bacterium]|nr:isoprenylcysteine carboxylmethyltransferase family protein [Nitrospiraceae bacterium]HNP30596.1 isoprenylcysteine carboxylmethyltransferase family protein [Nitrospirales bacterium]
MHSEPDKKGAAVKVPPPLIVLSVLLLAYALNAVVPFTIPPSPGVKFTGYTLLGISLVIIGITSWSFRREKTHIEPWKPTTTMITTGFFAISRNPIYLALCIGCIGIGLILQSWWVVFSVIPAAMLLYQFVITREEAYLEQKFGEAYVQYKRRVRRWL